MCQEKFKQRPLPRREIDGPVMHMHALGREVDCHVTDGPARRRRDSSPQQRANAGLEFA